MEIRIKGRQLIIKKEKGDRNYRPTNWCPDGESTVLYHVKKWLNENFNCNGHIRWIKKRMWKDGNLVADIQQYVRTSKPVDCIGGYIAFWNTHWQISGLDHDLAEAGEAWLQMEIM